MYFPRPRPGDEIYNPLPGVLGHSVGFLLVDHAQKTSTSFGLFRHEGATFLPRMFPNVHGLKGEPRHPAKATHVSLLNRQSQCYVPYLKLMAIQ